MTERHSHVALSIALDTLDQIGMMSKFDRASTLARSTAAFIRSAHHAAPPDPTAAHWREAIGEWGCDPCALDWIEQRARQLARENKTP